MTAHISKAVFPCLSVIWVASFISLKSSLSKSLNTSKKLSLFFPFVISLCTSYNAKYDDFFNDDSEGRKKLILTKITKDFGNTINSNVLVKDIRNHINEVLSHRVDFE